MIQKSALSCHRKLLKVSKTSGMYLGELNYSQVNVICHGAVGRDPKNVYFLVISTPFYEGILEKSVSGKISGAFLRVFFAILARRVGCMTKPF